MNIHEKADDWQVASIAQVGGAAAVGGGVFWYQFESPSKKLTESFMFTGYGLGVGGSMGGTSWTPDSMEPIDCDRPFAIVDLDSSAGRVSLLGASLMVGYSVMDINAFNLSGPLFTSQILNGVSVGVGATAISTVGMWRSATLALQFANRRALGR